MQDNEDQETNSLSPAETMQHRINGLCVSTHNVSPHVEACILPTGGAEDFVGIQLRKAAKESRGRHQDESIPQWRSVWVASSRGDSGVCRPCVVLSMDNTVGIRTLCDAQQDR
jgi:hypothetical protein